MGDIYARAHKVIVWLGTAADSSDDVMDWLPRFASELVEILTVLPFSRLTEYGLPGDTDPLWCAIGLLFRRPWFRRLWTFQEVLLGRAVSVVCGTKRVEWPAFTAAELELRRTGIRWLCVRDKVVGRHENGFLAVEEMSNLKAIFAEQGFLHLPILMSTADSKLCWDPRDKVYAMLGLTPESFRRRIPVSYIGRKTKLSESQRWR
jgi:hypothetical protein